MTTQTTYNNLPLYWALVEDDDCGMFCVSLVDRPAVERDFMAFGAQKTPQLYAVANEEKRIIRGVLMRANYPIYRRDDWHGEFYIAYAPETIRQMVERFMLQKRQDEVNIMHVDGSDVDGVTLVQIFIKDRSAGIDPAGFDDIEEGSLFGEYHVTNDEVWAKIKDGTFRGFSIEGVFGITQEHFNRSNMDKFKQLKARIAKLLATFGTITTDKAVLVWDGDEDLKAGDAVFVEDENGERKPAEDGDYKTEDGKTIKVEGGKVAEIADPEAEVEGAEEESPEDAPKDVPKNDDLKSLADRITAIEEQLSNIVAALEKNGAEIKALKQAPAAKPAHEAFNDDKKTGNAQIDQLRKVLGRK